MQVNMIFVISELRTGYWKTTHYLFRRFQDATLQYFSPTLLCIITIWIDCFWASVQQRLQRGIRSPFFFHLRQLDGWTKAVDLTGDTGAEYFGQASATSKDGSRMCLTESRCGYYIPVWCEPNIKPFNEQRNFQNRM